jgi:hypothetical protein
LIELSKLFVRRSGEQLALRESGDGDEVEKEVESGIVQVDLEHFRRQVWFHVVINGNRF